MGKKVAEGFNWVQMGRENFGQSLSRGEAGEQDVGEELWVLLCCSWLQAEAGGVHRGAGSPRAGHKVGWSF